MSGFDALSVDDILARGSVKDSDVLRFRRLFYEDGIVSEAEADQVFRLNDECPVKDSSWPDFFIEAIVDYIVFQARPQGYLTADNAQWLMAHVAKSGRIATRTEFDLVVSVLEKARWAPVGLAKFALEQIKLAVLDGDGPLRSAREAFPAGILVTEVDLIRRVLYAFGGEGHVAVTRDEADILFDIDEAVGGQAPNPAWTDLFVKAIANVMMAASGYAVPSREEALRQEASLDAPEQKASVFAFLLSMVHSNLSSVRDAYHDMTVEERALARLEHQRIEIITNEAITEAEASWLAARLGRDGRMSPSEHALISYLKRESPRIHPVLIEAVDRLGQAA